MPPAVIGGAIAAVGAIGGSILGASAQKKAVNAASDAQQGATAAQLQLGQASLALQQQLAQQSMGIGMDVYNSNYDLLSPWVARGNVAGDAYSALLGLPAAPAMSSPLAREGGGTYTANGGIPIGGGAPATGAAPIPGISAPPYTPAQIAAMQNDGIDGNAAQAQAANDAWYAANPQTAAAPAPAPAPAPTAATATMLAAPAPVAAAPAPVAAAPVASAPTAGAGTYGAGTHATASNGGEAPHLTSQYGPGSMQSTNAQSHPGGTATLDPAQGGGASIRVPTSIGSANITIPTVGSIGTTPMASTPPPAATPPAATTPAGDPYDAFQNFANSAGMQFQLEQGTDAINNLYAGRGALQSGAAMKAISDYAQNTALQNYFMPYMNMLGGVSATGAQAGSSIAGVGSQFSSQAAGINSNLGNAATGINGAMGGAIQNGANGLSNAAIANGAATAGMYGNIAGALGTFGSSFNAPTPFDFSVGY